MLEVLGAVAGIWVAFNFTAPYFVMFVSDRIGIGRVPADILERADAHGVRFYKADLLGRGLAFSVWCWPYKVVVLDKHFLAAASAAEVRFVLAHELAHILLGHTFRKWLSVVSLAVLFPQVRRRLKMFEAEADKQAESLGLVSRDVIYGGSSSNDRNKD